MATDIRVSVMKTPIDIAEYLFTRLYQLGVRTVQVVPGDYNLAALDYIPKVGLKWVGNCNELNAEYSADGYARIKGISAIIKTFGVGELSALNAIAGAYSEHVPVVHIHATPSYPGNGDYNVFANISANLAITVAKITDAHDAPTLIDHTLWECWMQCQPVYIALPTDMVQQKVEGERLRIPIDLDEPVNEAEKEEYVVEVVLKYLYVARSTVILVDAGAIRHEVLGVGAVDEALTNFGDVYAGSGSNEAFGPLKSDFNTTGFSYRTSQLNTIDFYSDHFQVRYSLYPKIRMRGILQKIIDRMGIMHSGTLEASNAPITHSWSWPTVGNWLQEGDIVITETGTANFGIWEKRFPKGVTAITTENQRVILLVGDGSFQMAAQEVSTMIRQKLNPIIYVICNGGYTIEGYIHGWDEDYNDIHPWKHAALVQAFGDKCQHSYSTYQASTRDELTSLLNNIHFSSAPHFQLVGLYMPKDDAPAALKLTAAAAAARNVPMEQ
ncbi:pyruvate decarboxylase [Aspergillus minisclerotigenes]|uniref:Pyruvate decarboxylase n=1 Tax=Aspergillus minisclerotigenes TaxID=656917 RepID=A0A5N6JK63_9EURO|nr:pyruvate decarboxylase [Aspergillus minisclerotigenes]